MRYLLEYAQPRATHPNPDAVVGEIKSTQIQARNMEEAELASGAFLAEGSVTVGTETQKRTLYKKLREIPEPATPVQLRPGFLPADEY
jgi:hypothetical protein